MFNYSRPEQSGGRFTRVEDSKTRPQHRQANTGGCGVPNLRFGKKRGMTCTPGKLPRSYNFAVELPGRDHQAAGRQYVEASGRYQSDLPIPESSEIRLRRVQMEPTCGPEKAAAEWTGKLCCQA